MAGSSHQVIRDFTTFGRPFWLPPGGWGNSLDDDSWVAIVDVMNTYVASDLLMTLKDARVPAYAAALRPPRACGPVSPHTSRPVRIWVGAHAYGRGQTTILQAIPELERRFGPDAFRR